MQFNFTILKGINYFLIQYYASNKSKLKTTNVDGFTDGLLVCYG